VKTTFQIKKENFICEVCGRQVIGDGYTNHCPYCLWSKHTDINPGDRKSDCFGLMEPIGLIKKNQETKIVFRCLKCHQKKLNRTAKNDNPKLLLKLAKIPVDLS